MKKKKRLSRSKKQRTKGRRKGKQETKDIFYITERKWMKRGKKRKKRKKRLSRSKKQRIKGKEKEKRKQDIFIDNNWEEKKWRKGEKKEERKD